MDKLLSKIKDRAIRNPVISLAYRLKFYFDVGVTQITWVTGKLPEIMAFVYLAEKFGVVLTRSNIVILALIVAMSILAAGYMIKTTGLYDVERYVDAKKNPVMKEILDAARKINKER